MIQARVTAITPSHSGRDAKAFALSRSLISPENPKGELMFYVAPPFWTGGKDPHVGQTVIVGQIERKTNPRWRQPRWLARDVSSAYAIRHYSPKRLSEETTRSSDSSPTWIERLLHFLGLRGGRSVRRA